MVQDLTKSALSFSWALSLLMMKQAVAVARPGQGGDNNVFAPLARAAVDQLDDSMKNLYHSGDNVQQRGVDLAFSIFDPSTSTNAQARREMNSPGDTANGSVPPFPAQLWSLLTFANPVTWMNRIMQGMQNCSPCGGGPAQDGRRT